MKRLAMDLIHMAIVTLEISKDVGNMACDVVERLLDAAFDAVAE